MFSWVKVYIKHVEEAVVDFDACFIFQTYHLISPIQYLCFIKCGYAVRKRDAIQSGCWRGSSLEKATKEQTSGEEHSPQISGGT